MKRLLLLCLLLCGCSSTPTAPTLPLSQVQRGPVDGDPAAPRIQKLTAFLNGETLLLKASLVPQDGPLPSYAALCFQAWVGTHWLDPGMSTSAEYVIVAREIEDIGPLARTIRRTNYPNQAGWGSCRPGKSWCDSTGVATVQVLNGREIVLSIPRRSLDNATSPVAVWMQLTNGDIFVGGGYAMTGTNHLARTEN